MLKGDLTSTPLAPLLRDLAGDAVTGCLHVTNPDGDEALIYFKAGLIYSVSVPGTRPQLGAKLVSSGALGPEALSEALEAQRTELQGWRLGELLVHLGYVDQPVVEAFVMEQVTEALWDLLRWTEGRWKFRKNIRAREDVGPPMVVVELLEALRDRGYEWENISAVVHGPAAVPKLSTRGGGSAETTLDNDAWSMLCKIDGERSVADLARDCGYTLFEAGQVIVQLVQAGLVDIDEDLDLAGGELYGATTLSSALAGDLDEADSETAGEDADDAGEDVLSRLARLVNEVAGEHSHDESPNGTADSGEEESRNGNGAPRVGLAPPLTSGVTSFDNPMIVPLHRNSTESFAASIARVSNALSDVLGETPDVDEVDSAAAAAASKPVSLKRSKSSTSDPEWQRRKRLRSAAAAELASAQAMVETLRAEQDTVEVDESASDAHIIDFEEDLDGRLPAAELIAEQFAADQAEAEQHAAEEAEAERLAAEQAEAEIIAAEQAEHLAAVEAEAEQIAVEQAEAERIAAEQAEAERIAAEQAEAERLAAEQAEAERLAAEQAEADRLAAEEADRLAAEEAERAALEELAWAEYWEREEAERALAEQIEAERLAAEQAEAERLAAEEAEAERLAAEEAERLAAEEAERIAAEQAEAERLAEQVRAERLAAEEEAAAIEAERRAAEQAELERAEAEAAEWLAAELAAQEAADAETAEAQAAETAMLEAEQSDADSGEHYASDDAAPASETRAERSARRKAEKQAAEEAARAADEAAAATALLIELAASEHAEAPGEEPAAVATAETEQAPADDAAPAGDGYDDEVEEVWNEAAQADTAALLRELSSLGIDDEPAAAPPSSAAQRPRPAPTEKKAKKKIGLFGL